MKARTYIIAFAMLLSMGGIISCSRTGCDKVDACNYDPKAKTNDGSCIDKGKAIFWQSTAGSGFNIVVTVNGTEATITSEMTGTPLCDAPGNATFSLCPGSHNYTAREVLPGTETWSGNANVTEDGCLTVQLD